ncbi:MAG: hypothetical protein G01um101418_599 [Parcubacteria group bacterium Gr01-1014_18]|nr:MAG: hypothetical protein Greene041636_110 [Parcubacteria group bacterium Greene0416_36]TSC80851.1 MAG: hypothetical protein G01um101418_599 [Parcubacteria group bacterium Gr01-1014_18]TSC99512.1 MAG: hypothetical protein Greene101420_179 [Parcubacteria group bacterium Greene1014_20]TSD07569.1 MAG: hypothetical protein Greene07142_26 [Parcubacteria group bacterium Greene0714_2]
MIFRIYTLKKQYLEKELVRLTLGTDIGQLTVLDHHVPYLTAARGGMVELETSDGLVEKLEVTRGVLEVLPGSRVNLLADLRV